MTQLIGSGVAVVGAILAIFGYIRATRVDKATEELGLASNRSNEVNLVVAGQNHIIENLQEDNKSVREEMRVVTEENRTLRAELRAAAIECDALAMKLRRLERKFGKEDNT